MKGRPPRGYLCETVSVEISSDLLDRLRCRAGILNPVTGRFRHGALRRTITEALQLWLQHN